MRAAEYAGKPLSGAGGGVEKFRKTATIFLQCFFS
jgi:hypothetical protein